MKPASEAKDFPVVCVGGSAGGLDAYIRLAQIHDGLAIVSSPIRAGTDDITDAKKDGRNLPMRRPFANFGDHIRREQADRPGRWNESRLGGDEPRESPS